MLFRSKKETVKEFQEKIKRIFKGIQSDKEIKLRLWKIIKDDIEGLDKIYWENIKSKKETIGVEGELINDTSLINDLGIEEITVILVETPINGKDFIFTQKKIMHPRISSSNINDNNWKELAVIDNNKFVQIPLKILANPGVSKCGRTGLYNLKNTCYMNSALQCLSNCQELTKYFLLKLYVKDINEKKPLGHQGKLANAYYALIENMWRGNRNAISPTELKDLITEKAEQFVGYSQQDSQEFIHYMLDILGEDLNRVKVKPYIEFKEENLSDLELSNKLWEYHLSRNKSIITDFFCGQLWSNIKCPKCNNKSTSFDPFMMLSVDIPVAINIELVFIPLSVNKDIININITVPSHISLLELGKRLAVNLILPETRRSAVASVSEEKIMKKLQLELCYNKT